MFQSKTFPVPPEFPSGALVSNNRKSAAVAKASASASAKSSLSDMPIALITFAWKH